MRERFDILVVGVGPAGIAAALSAVEAEQRVGLVDDNPAPGGQIWRSGVSQPAAARSLLAKLDAAPVQRLQGWRVLDSAERGVLRAECENECADLRYGKLILATGARERFLPFPGWTLPNVMGAGGLDAMVRGGLPIAGKRVVVAGTGPLLLAVAAHLARKGAIVVAICEQASLRRLVRLAGHLVKEPAKLLQGIEHSAATFGAKFYTSCWAAAANGREKLETVTLERNGKRWDERCDYLACGYHLNDIRKPGSRNARPTVSHFVRALPFQVSLCRSPLPPSSSCKTSRQTWLRCVRFPAAAWQALSPSAQPTEPAVAAKPARRWRRRLRPFAPDVQPRPTAMDRFRPPPRAFQRSAIRLAPSHPDRPRP